MSSVDRRHLLLALTAVGVCCVAPIALGASADVLLAAPVLLLALPLLTGRYLGEETLERLARDVVPAVRHARPVTVRRSRRGDALLPRGGALLAFALAVRPPPMAQAIR